MSDCDGDLRNETESVSSLFKPSSFIMYQHRVTGQTFEASQWFKNGDHPLDHSYLIYRHNHAAPFLSEGRVVRRYRNPYVRGDEECMDCEFEMDDHGRIDIGSHGITVCPGDWIVSTDRWKDQYLVVCDYVFRYDYMRRSRRHQDCL
jgi:hypothetical protein